MVNGVTKNNDHCKMVSGKSAFVSQVTGHKKNLLQKYADLFSPLPILTAFYRFLLLFTASYRFLPLFTAFYRLGGRLPFPGRQTIG